MTHDQTYLEIAADGRCLAHVPGLPGCIVRASSRADAVDQLPQAIRNHNDWLRGHVEHVADVDAWNAAHVDARRGQSWEQVWEDLLQARCALKHALARMSQRDLERAYPFPWGPQGTPYQWVAIYVGHDRSHARNLRARGLRACDAHEG